ncbi:MAG TPA: DoxX family protein [Vicinamibacterales bacterium]|nr:DoxX family protein [Vicinamibacterales bacterium]
MRSALAEAGSEWAPRTWFVIVRGWLQRFPISLILLAMRIGVGSVFFKAGLLKYQSFEFAVKLFEDEYKVPILSPIVAARITMFNELTWPIFLFLGLGTRFATLPILASIAVIQLFVYPSAWTENLVWASILVMLLTRGAGALSLDFLIDRYFETRNARR